MYVVLQFLTDFAWICFKMCVLTVRKTCTRRIFDFRFWELFRGKKLEKSLKKLEKNVTTPSIFDRFCSDLF